MAGSKKKGLAKVSPKRRQRVIKAKHCGWAQFEVQRHEGVSYPELGVSVFNSSDYQMRVTIESGPKAVFKPKGKS